MELKFPESSHINPPHKIEGSMREARESFYELSKGKIKYMHSAEFKNWLQEITGVDDLKVGSGFGPFWVKMNKNGNEVIDKFIENLEIGINLDDFIIDGKSYEDLIPFITEHELHEAWLNTKKGTMADAFEQEDLMTKHYLAERKEFSLAEKAGLAEKLLEWRIKMMPELEKEYKSAFEYAKRKNSK